MDTKLLITFMTVAQKLNFGEAALILNYSQSTISDQIKNLEEHLGIKLFERLGKKVILTEYGHTLIPYAQNMINYSEELHRLFNQSDKISGTLTIGAAESLCVYWLPAVIKSFKTKYPDVFVKVKLGNCHEFPEWLQLNKIDLAFSLNAIPITSYLSEIKLFDMDTVLFASAQHDLATNKTVTVQSLKDQSLILPEAECDYRNALEFVMQKNEIHPLDLISLNSIEAIKKCVLNGLGISLLPRIVLNDELARGELVELNFTEPMIVTHARLLLHKDKWRSPALIAFMDEVMRSVG